MADKAEKRGTGAWKKWLALIAVLVVAAGGGIGWLVHSNNVAQKATHAEFSDAQKAWEKADDSFQEASQKLKGAANGCAKAYGDYDVCPALVSTRDSVDSEYAKVEAEVNAIDASAVDKMPEATKTLQTATATVQDLERTADKAVDTYESDLLKAVREEHSTLLEQARTNLKEAQALLSTSEGRTSDADLWKAISTMLAAHEATLDEQESVKSDDPDDYIESSQIVRQESAAIASEMAHLEVIYDSSAAPSASASTSASASASASELASAEASESASAETEASESPSASESDEAGLEEDPDA